MTLPRWQLRTRPDAGSATVLVLGLTLVVLLAGIVAAGLGAVAVARHRAASAADLAALAVAARASHGQVTACAAGGRVAARAGAALTSCRLEGWEAVVVAAVRPPGPVGALGVARVPARAGPAARAAPREPPTA
ncbi:MAG TPA: Rv3654c family TadE-like protein [Mycobacteriales bacterium]|nr:Rv3654c family TadE-like protein [Mycobacteriales bacterium]